METSKFSLSFSKKIEKKVLQPSALRVSSVKAEGPKKETIESIEDNVIASDVQESTELVIPLLQDDRPVSFKAKVKDVLLAGTKTELIDEQPNNDNIPATPLTLDQLAENALLAEANDNISRGAADSSRSITQLSDDFQQSSSSKAGIISTLDDYDEVPVESFGAAMLRGMGWKKNEGVGNVKNRKVVCILEVSNKSLSSASDWAAKEAGGETDKQGEEELPLVLGCHVFLHAGRNKGAYGMVECVEEDHVLVRRAVTGGAMLREVAVNLRVVTKQHYTEHARVINKKMYDTFKNEENDRKGLKKRRREKTDEAASEDSCENENSRARDSMKQKENLSIASTSERCDPVKVKKEELRSSADNKDVKVEYSNNDQNNDRTPAKQGTFNTDIRLKYNTESNTSKNENKDSVQKFIKELVAYSTSRYSYDNVNRSKSEHYSNASMSDFDKTKSRNKKYCTSDASSYRHSPTRVIETSIKDERISLSDRDDACEKVTREERQLDIRDRDKRRRYETQDKRRDEKSTKRKYDKNCKQLSRRSKHNESAEHHVLTPAETIASKYGDCSRSKEKAPWVTEGLTVRIISDQYKKGHYYKEKVIVETVLTAEDCQCRTQDGKILARLPLHCLETVIPKHWPRTVLILKGSHAGQVGVVLEQHKSSQEASVQLQDDVSVILRLHYENICQYKAT